MNIKKWFYISILAVSLFVWFGDFSYASHFRNTYQNTRFNTSGIIADDVLDLMEDIAGFLMITGGILAGIVLIVAGIMYMAAGSNQTKVASAKSVFNNGIIGALILFAFGIIINTIVAVASDPFGFFS